MPYDPKREILDIKATRVLGKDPIRHMAEIIPQFQPNLRRKIVLFGAESVGKTTLSRRLAENLGGQFFPEYARPYLEMVGNDLSNDKMTDIMNGQRVLQEMSNKISRDKPFSIFDTDLYSTVGYWNVRPAGRSGRSLPLRPSKQG